VIVPAVLLRHGETADTRAGIITGQLDPPLTEDGRRQARDAAHALARHGVARIVASDLSRARETAEIVARELGLAPPAIDARWRERHWGVRQGAVKSAVRADADAEAPKGGESEAELDARIAQALAALEPRTLVVAHAGAFRAARRVLGLAPRELAPAQFMAVGDAPPRAGACRLVAEVLTRGELAGRVVHVERECDLDLVDQGSLVLLHRVEKALAVEAIGRARAAINLTRALTAHITHGRTAMQPYAVAIHWPDGLPADGDEVECTVEPPARRPRRGPVFPDPPVAQHACASCEGGKAAGLRLLCEVGVRVPEFHALSFDSVEQAVSGHGGDLAALCARLAPDARWAVRSSADIEDGAHGGDGSGGDPMSGSFHTVLGCTPADVTRAVLQVAASVYGAEIDARLRAGTLAARPRMAVVVQRMIERPLLAGAVFIPAPNDAREALIEARVGGTGDGLMDGTEAADVRARCTADGRVVETHAEGEPASPTASAVDLARALADVAREAVRVHRATGRGDLEFAVDRDGHVQWLQARELRSVVEVVDRSGFHPAAAGYYRLLAASVAEANLTEPVSFRLIELGGGRFGYTHGIRARDESFHAAVERDIEHLARVTAHGWAMDRRMRDLLDDPQSDPLRLWRALIAHGAVQLPFSIPIGGGLMERFSSWSSDDGGGSGLLERDLGVLLAGTGIVPQSGGAADHAHALREVIRVLRTPCDALSIAEADEALARYGRTHPHASDADVLGVFEPEWRDVPRLDPEAMLRWCAEADARLSRAGSAEAAARRAADARAANRSARTAVAAWSRAVEHANGPAARRRFDLWADYLLMKAETNEFHAVARGRVFRRLGEAGFEPVAAMVAQAFAARMGGERTASA